MKVLDTTEGSEVEKGILYVHVAKYFFIYLSLVCLLLLFFFFFFFFCFFCFVHNFDLM